MAILRTASNSLAHEVGEGQSQSRSPILTFSQRERELAACVFAFSHSRERYHVLEFRDGLFSQLTARPTHFWKLFFPGERPYGIKNRSSIGMIFVVAFLRRHTRIERRRPAAVDNIDVRRRVDPCHHRPEHFLDIRRVDVFIDDHDVPAVAIGGGATERRRARLLRMAGIFLLDRNHG